MSEGIPVPYDAHAVEARRQAAWRERGAFGLPAELGAIASGEPPSEWVKRCAAHMTGQLQRLGFSFDWERSFSSADAIMYRWSQWLFVTLLEAGLVYQST